MITETIEKHEYGDQIYVWYNNRIRKALFIQEERNSIYSYVVLPEGQQERIQRRYIKWVPAKVVAERIMYLQEEQVKVLAELHREIDLH